MKLELLVTFEDGTEKTMMAKAPDFVAFEERFDISMATLGANTKLTHLFFLAYAALNRSGEANADSFEAWLEKVELVTAKTPKK